MEILDCTLRDGGYLNNWKFSLEFGKDLYRTLSEVGIDYVELGFIYEEGEYYKSLTVDRVNELVDGVEDGAKTCVMIDFNKCDFNLPHRDKTKIDMVRVAAHKYDIYDALYLCGVIKDKGYKSSLQMMNFPSYSTDELQEVCRSAGRDKVDYLYMADSFGNMCPEDLEDPIYIMNSLGIRSGFHAHDNLSLAYVNSVDAAGSDISILDGTVLGVGRGAGNLKLEQILCYENMAMAEPYEVGKVFDFIEKYDNEFAACGIQHHCEYMISGFFGVHPNSVSKMRDDGNSYSFIWRKLYEQY